MNSLLSSTWKSSAADHPMKPPVLRQLFLTVSFFLPPAPAPQPVPAPFSEVVPGYPAKASLPAAKSDAIPAPEPSHVLPPQLHGASFVLP